MRIADVDEIMDKILYSIKQINHRLDNAMSPSVDYLTGLRKGLIDAYLLLNGLTVTTKESDYKEPEINPCRGCEDYDGRGGCKSHDGCGEEMGEENENWYTELDDPKIAERSEE